MERVFTGFELPKTNSSERYQYFPANALLGKNRATSRPRPIYAGRLILVKIVENKKEKRSHM